MLCARLVRRTFGRSFSSSSPFTRDTLPPTLSASLPRGASFLLKNLVFVLWCKGNNSGCLEAPASHFSTGFMAPPVLKPTSARQRRAHFHPFGVALQGHEHFFENRLVMPLKTVSMYLRTGLPKNSSHIGIGRLEFFLRCAFRFRPTSFRRSS